MKILIVCLLVATVHSALLGGGDHDHDHEHHDFPLATGNEAKLASVRLFEFFNAVEEEEPLPRDMPSYNELPENIQFTCDNKLPGYYADVDFGCQVYHMCRDHPEHGVASFLCPNATIFHQEIFACDWWFNVDCPSSPNFFNLNEEIYKDPEEEVVSSDASQQFQSFGQFDDRLVRSAIAPLDLMRFDIIVPASANNIRKQVNAINDYLPPSKDGYLPPIEGYLPPDNNGYLPPVNDGYLPPVNDGYLPPVNDGYLPPDNGYLPPKDGYLPPI